jgi:hypothetical protein
MAGVWCLVMSWLDPRGVSCIYYVMLIVCFLQEAISNCLQNVYVHILYFNIYVHILFLTYNMYILYLICMYILYLICMYILFLTYNMYILYFNLYAYIVRGRLCIWRSHDNMFYCIVYEGYNWSSDSLFTYKIKRSNLTSNIYVSSKRSVFVSFDTYA